MKTARCLRTSFLLFLFSFPASAAEPPAAGAETNSLREIPRHMQRIVDDGAIAGAVTLVARHDRIASLEAVGYSDLSGRRPMRPDDLFWIASMTKPMTATAVLMLQEAGQLSVEDPVEKYLPEFQKQWVIENRTNDLMVLKRPARPITLHDLLTHASGLGDVGAPRPDCSLAELAMAYSQQPLQFPPGSKWSYCNAGINTLGRIIEVVSGQSYADFMRRRLFDPLGMKDTTFWPTPHQLRRLAKSYQPAAAGGLEETPIFFLKGNLSDHHRTAYPSGGLFSTASDVARFYQMMLNHGKCRGKRILAPATVAELTRTQSGDLKTGFTAGMSYGFGFAVVKEPAGVTAMFAPGTFGHGGAFGTQSWADPTRDVALILMIQRAKLPNSDASDVRRDFQETAMRAFAE